MKLPNIGWSYFLILSLIMVAWAIPLIVSTDLAVQLVKEDGVYEYLSCLFFAISALLFFLAFLKTTNSAIRYWFLLLALAMFFGAGEEISWGQRIFGWQTPADSSNIQGETTIHNLPMFDTVEGGIFKMSRLFMIFCVLWGFILPLLHMTVPFARTLIHRLYLPIVPLTIGVLFLVNILVSKIFQRMIDEPYISRIAETREAAQALLLVAIAYYFYSKSMVNGSNRS